MNNFKIVFSAFFAGILLSFAYPHFAGNGFFIFAPFSYGLYYFFIFNETKLRKKLLITFFYCFGFSTVGFYWIPQTLSTFGSMPLVFGYLISILFCLIVLPQLWPLVFIQHYLKIKKVNHSNQIVILCITHLLLEQFICGQFPVWIGHSLLTTNLKLILTSYFGVGIYSFSLLLLALNFSSSLLKKGINFTQIGIACFILIFDVILHFAITIPSSLKDYSSKSIQIRFAQANIGNFLKIESENGLQNSVLEVYSRYKKLSSSQTQSPIDLIIWPETAIPTVFNSEHLHDFGFKGQMFMTDVLNTIYRETDLLFGGYDEGKIELSANSEQSQYNSAFLISNSKIDVYHKIKLIPFGETLPFGRYNQSLYTFFPGVSLFSKGNVQNFFSIKNEYRFITPICYEILDTHFMRNFAQATSNLNFIVNLTNDSWYGDTAEPWQHLFLARWRSLELRKPILRSTNTGITTVIDELGRFYEFLPVGKEDKLDVKLYIHEINYTIYQKFGLLPLVILLFIFSLSNLSFKKLKRHL